MLQLAPTASLLSDAAALRAVHPRFPSEKNTSCSVGSSLAEIIFNLFRTPNTFCTRPRKKQQLHHARRRTEYITSVATRAIRRKKNVPPSVSLIFPFSFAFLRPLLSLLFSFNFLVEELAHRLPNEIHTTRHRSQPRSTCGMHVHARTYASLCRRKSEMGAVSRVLEKYQDPVRFRFVRSIKSTYVHTYVCSCVGY